jgi:hypothetical protein
LLRNWWIGVIAQKSAKLTLLCNKRGLIPNHEKVVVSKSSGKYRFFFQIVCWLMCTPVIAQVTNPVVAKDSVKVGKDTIPAGTKDSVVVDLNKIKISNDALDDVVDYGAKDSMWFDVKKKQVHLYGKASVKYSKLSIAAGYILLDYEKSEITAEQFPDSTGHLTGLPEFKDGQEDFTATRLRYNFKTKKGIIYEARTKQEDLYVLGERAKFVGVAHPDPDTTKKQGNTIYNENALLTTCDDPHPHFGIRTRKLKVIPDKLVVTGFSNVEIAGVPTPLIIPFGFFPITKTRKAGLIIPHDFENSNSAGFGIKDFGWYQPISPYMDATVLFNAYTNGSWGISNNLRYNRKYKYTGNFALKFNNRVTEDEHANPLSAKSFSLNWTHNQDSKANPTDRFGGSINIETNRDQNRNLNDYNSVYKNSLSSNLNYSKTFPGKPFLLTIGMTHSQNTQTRTMDISLPNASFTMQRIYPFKRKEAVGAEKWYEKISLTYNSALQNNFHTVDTLLFTRKTLQSAKMGIQHRASTDYSFKLFKYINIAPNVSYEEDWYPYTIRTKLDTSKNVYHYDSTFQMVGSKKEYISRTLNTTTSTFGRDTTTRVWGFSPFRTFNAAISANTSLYLTKQYKHGWFRGIRHTIKPSVSLGFGPDYTRKQYDSYFKTYETSTYKKQNDTVHYTIFDQGIFNKPPSTRTPRDLVLNYSLTNILDFKYFNAKRDTVIKKKIFDNLTFTGNYSLTRDTLKWSPISTGGLFRFFKGVTTLTWNAQFDPYIADAKGNRINKYVLREKHKLVRLTGLNFGLNTNFTVGQLMDFFAPKDEKGNTISTQADKSTRDDLLGWFEKFNVSHTMSLNRKLIPTGYGTERDTFIIGSNSIRLSGDIPLNAKWKININNISYDFQSKSLVYPDVGFSRDLHCWEMRLSWQPVRGTFAFTINVKPGTLEFLKVPYKKSYYDAQPN